MSTIRHIAPAAGSPSVALGKFKHEVAIWDLDPPRKLATFTTVLEFGGRRLALDREARRCFAAAYHVYGLACYDTEDGEVCWSRRDLKKAQGLRPSIDGSGIYVFFDQGPAQFLDAKNGKTTDRHRGVRDIVESPFGAVDLFSRSKLELRSRDGSLRAALDRSTFALLSASFSPSCVATSEGGGPVRWFDLESGRELWRYKSKPGCHVLEVGYCSSTESFYGVEWPYEHGGPKTLLRFDQQSRSATVVALVGTPAETSFCVGGECLLTSDGFLFQLPTLGTIRLGF